LLYQLVTYQQEIRKTGQMGVHTLGGINLNFLIFSPSNTFAFLVLLYTDPGSGTLAWQLILAAFFGGMFYFRRLKDYVIRKRK